jgi:hypothetical protein
MEHNEFIKALEDYTLLEGYEENITQKFPIVKHFLANYGPMIQVNGNIMNFKLCEIQTITTKEDWLAMNQAFNSILERFKKNEFKKQ